MKCTARSQRPRAAGWPHAGAWRTWQSWGTAGTLALDVRPRVKGRAAEMPEERLKDGQGSAFRAVATAGCGLSAPAGLGCASWPDSAFPGPPPADGNLPLPTPSAPASPPPKQRRLLGPLCWPRPRTRPLVRSAQGPGLSLPPPSVHSHCGWAGRERSPRPGSPQRRAGAPPPGSGASRRRWKRALCPSAIQSPHPPPLGRRHLLPGTHVEVLRVPPGSSSRRLRPRGSFQNTQKVRHAKPTLAPPGLVYTEGARAAPTPSPGPSRLSTQKSEDGRRRRGRGIF